MSDTDASREQRFEGIRDRIAEGGDSKLERRSASLWERFVPETLRKILRNPLGAFGMVLLVLFAGIALAAPWLAPPPVDDYHLLWESDDFAFPNYRIPQDGYSGRPTLPNPGAWQTFPPNWELHPLGTASSQYDIYFGMIWGTRLAFAWAFIIVGIGVGIGVVMGSLAGFFGGWLDEVIMRLVDTLFAFPNLLLAIVLLTVFSSPLHIPILDVTINLPKFWTLVVALVAFEWLTYARILRGDILTVKNQEYVASARAMGASNWRLVGKHVLPNSIYPVFVLATLNIGSVVVTVATLSFFGLGLQTGSADWGQLVSFSRQWILGNQGDPLIYWFTFVPPAVAITLFVLAWNLVGDAFRDVMDPRMRN